MEEQRAYRLFGDLYLDPPSSNSFLSRKLERLKPYIRDLERRHTSGTRLAWNCEEAFKHAARAEVADWEKRGLQRDMRFLIPPDGPLDAPLSCHLHNPNFNVSDPYASHAGDVSSLSIDQIMSAGFTPDKVLLDDHTFRRETVDGIAAYPPEILNIHESFTSELRSNMAAVVDVVWGALVRERMKKTHRLEELQLWGHYKGVSIFLEWETTGAKLVRFVMFVCHPEAMIYGERETLGRKQDLHLEVAAKLARIRIMKNFYERTYRPSDHKFLSGRELARRDALNRTAIEQLESVAYRSRSVTHSGQQRRNRVPLLERERLRRYPGLDEYFKRHSDEELPESNNELKAFDSGSEGQQHDLIPSFYIHPEIDNEFDGPVWLRMLASSLVDHENENMTIPDSIQLCNALLNGEFDVSWAARWGDLPCELRAWIQRQDGLKFCGRSVTSIPELFEVHALLAKKTPISEEDLGVSITDIILQVIARYYRLLSRATRDSSIEHLIVRGTAPVPLKCSRCESRLLDGPFPRYKKVDTERYVAHNLKRGCGSETCQADKGHGFAVPWDVKKPWVAPKTDPLKRPPMKAKWTDLLLLHAQRNYRASCKSFAGLAGISPAFKLTPIRDGLSKPIHVTSAESLVAQSAAELARLGVQ